jgi:hypothetical protein
MKNLANGLLGTVASLGSILASTATNIDEWLKVALSLGGLVVVVFTIANGWIDLKEKMNRWRAKKSQSNP